MNESKYLIKYAVSPKNQRYVKPLYETSSYCQPNLTPDAYRVKSEYIFETPEDAEVIIDKLVSFYETYFAKKCRAFNGIKKHYTSKEFQYISAAQDMYKAKRAANRENYTIEEYVPTFVCNKKRKTAKRKWKDDGAASTFCACCGSNIYYGKYVEIRQAKICPFCLIQLGLEGTKVASELKKEDKDIEDNYNTTIFLEHMD